MKKLKKVGSSVITGVSHFSIFALGWLKVKTDLFDYEKDSNGKDTPILNRKKAAGVSIAWHYYFLFWTITITTKYAFSKMELV